MLRLPIQQLVQKVGRELTKPKQETVIHYINFEKIKKYKPQAFGGRAEIELKDFSNVSKGIPYDTYSAPFKK